MINKTYIQRFKQNIIALMAICLINLWTMIYSPVQSRLGLLTNFILFIASLIFFIYMSIKPERYENALYARYLDHYPDNIRYFYKFLIIWIYHMGYLFCWYKNYYNTNTIGYIQMYIYYITIFMLARYIVKPKD